MAAALIGSRSRISRVGLMYHQYHQPFHTIQRRTFAKLSDEDNKHQDLESHPRWKELSQKYWDEAIAKEHEAEQNLPWYRKTKVFMKRYGFLGYGIYTATWASVLGVSYLGIKTGVIDYSSWGQIYMDKLEHFYINSLETFGINPEHHPVTKKTEDWLVALAIAKITKPVQFLFTLGVTPRISRALNFAPKIPNEKLLRNRVRKKVRETIENLKDH